MISKAVSLLVKAKNWTGNELAGGVALAILVAFSLQFFTTLSVLISAWPQYSYRPPELSITTTNPASKPDVYYIVLDRYTSQSVLTNQFGFDNSDFLSFLTTNQFSVNPNAHSNYPYTTMSIASTLNADYHTDPISKFASASNQTLEPYHDSIRYASVIQEFKKLGYSYYHLGSWYEASNQAPLADHYFQPEGQLTIAGQTIPLNTFSKNELSRSLYWDIVNQGITMGKLSLLGYSGQNEVDATLSKISTLKNLAVQPSGGRFIFAHILVPHDPYYFNADGSLSASSGNDNVGQTIKQKYVGQVEYINSQMKDILTSVQTHSQGKAVVIVQADEGPYPMQLNDQNFDQHSVGDELSNGDMSAWSDQNLQMKYGILAAYHLPQASPEALAAGGDSVNIFRVFFNSYFGSKLPYLPRCYYDFPNGRGQSFVYSDITSRLTGQSSSLCPKDSKF
jgi:hypothetical protein